jgi:hypothetical protein
VVDEGQRLAARRGGPRRDRGFARHGVAE